MWTDDYSVYAIEKGGGGGWGYEPDNPAGGRHPGHVTACRPICLFWTWTRKICFLARDAYTPYKAVKHGIKIDSHHRKFRHFGIVESHDDHVDAYCRISAHRMGSFHWLNDAMLRIFCTIFQIFCTRYLHCIVLKPTRTARKYICTTAVTFVLYIFIHSMRTDGLCFNVCNMS